MRSRLRIAIGATKAVLDAVLTHPVRGPRMATMDLRYFWYKSNGSLHAPAGGQQKAPRQTGTIDTTPYQFYRHIKEYRQRYPDKAILRTGKVARDHTWAFLMGGGSMLIQRLQYADGSPNSWDPPTSYAKPPDADVVLSCYNFINANLATALKKMKPAAVIASNTDRNWCIAETNRNYLVYALQGGQVQVDLGSAAGFSFSAKWLDPRTGVLLDANGGSVNGGVVVTFNAPDSQDSALWLRNSGTTPDPTIMESPAHDVVFTPDEVVAATGSDENLAWTINQQLTNGTGYHAH